MTNARFTTVAEAAKFLDENQVGWYKSVDVDRLDMGNSNRCVLGQIYGNWACGLDKFGIQEGVEKAIFGYQYFDRTANAPLCKELWTTEINARLSPKLTALQQAELTIVELENKLQEERSKLEALRNPEVSVTLSKEQWKAVVRVLHSSSVDGSIADRAGVSIQRQIGE